MVLENLFLLHNVSVWKSFNVEFSSNGFACYYNACCHVNYNGKMIREIRHSTRNFIIGKKLIENFSKIK